MGIGLTGMQVNWIRMDKEQLAEELQDLMDEMESLVEKGITAKEDYEEFKDECRDILEQWEEFTDAEMAIESELQQFMESHQETIEEIEDKIQEAEEEECKKQHRKRI